MSSRNTYQDGRHASREGGIVTPLSISVGDWRAIEDAVGKVSDDDRIVLTDICEICRHIATLKRVTMGEIRKTLDDISRLSDDEKIITAMENCDELSRASIHAALHRMEGANQVLRPAKIRAAAWLASQNLPKNAGGAPIKGWRIILAEFVSDYCLKRGLGSTASSLNGVATPPVNLLMALIWIIDPDAPPEDSSVGAKLLRRVIA